MKLAFLFGKITGPSVARSARSLPCRAKIWCRRPTAATTPTVSWRWPRSCSQRKSRWTAKALEKLLKAEENRQEYWKVRIDDKKPRNLSQTPLHFKYVPTTSHSTRSHDASSLLRFEELRKFQSKERRKAIDPFKETWEKSPTGDVGVFFWIVWFVGFLLKEEFAKDNWTILMFFGFVVFPAKHLPEGWRPFWFA